MIDSRILLSKKNGEPIVNGYTIKAYLYSSDSGSTPAYTTGSPLYTYTNNGDGTYQADITSTIKATIHIFNSNDEVLTTRSNMVGILLQGDNQPTIQPGGAA